MTDVVDISIIVRAYNASNYIIQALYSILKNEYEGTMEIVVCYDNGSKDDTLVKVRRFESSLYGKYENVRMKIVEHDHMTPFRALLECGFKYSSGRFISILDADNLYPRRRVSTLISAWKRTKASFIFTPTISFEDGTFKVLKKIEAPKNPCSQLNLIKGNYIDTGAMFIHKCCLDKIIPKLSELRDRIYDWIFEDWLLALLAIKYCQCFYTNETYSLYRVHKSNLTGFRPKEPSKHVFTKMRDVVTLMAYYELERKNLSIKELGALYSALLKKYLELGYWLRNHFNISKIFAD